ncbi:hypothetical protein H0A36_15765 [Endozoicomonas sp. SM1973]|uniref:Lipoprotein n=1 Tax=Spartinivicinus marinus TaxID=2994442 RepID=A0A853IBM9_9GAMM|nr:hypothetical protein [Spartinivicinus marinus]MCX4028413.1 hypothetical protein [Spartinivicinus marinus]NYZ67474.1 hypothetical protein [Spartinivicinus marinus]
MFKVALLNTILIFTATACSNSSNSIHDICYQQEHICNQVANKERWPRRNNNEGFEYKWHQLQLTFPSSISEMKQINNSAVLNYPENTSIKVTPLILFNTPLPPSIYQSTHNSVSLNQFQVEFQLTLNDLPKTIDNYVEEAVWKNGLFGKILNADQKKWYYSNESINAYIYQHNQQHHIAIITHNKIAQQALEIIIKGDSVKVENIISTIQPNKIQ